MTLGAPPPGVPVTAAGGVEPRQRLHPLSPLLHSAKLLAVVIAAISIQGAAQLGPLGFLGAVVVTTCFAMAYSVVTWLVTGYHVIGRELRIYDGVVVRRTRAIPLERLQAVEVVRPLLARMTGLAELRLEVVGGGKTEAPLAFLTMSDAAALRERLLALAARVGARTLTPPAGQAPPGTPFPQVPPGQPHRPGEAIPPAHPSAPPPPGDRVPPEQPSAAVGVPGGPQAQASWPQPAALPAPSPAERPLHAVVNHDVLVSQLLTPQVIFLPLAIALVVTQYWFGTGAWSLVVLASMAAAIVGVIQQPVRRVMSDWNFRIAMQPAPPGKRYPGLRIRHGLTETRSQTVPLNRVQAVGVTWPLLWRGKRWLRCRLDVAGYGTPSEGPASSDRLLPVGDLATGRWLVGLVLPGVDLTSLRLVTPPARARWLAPLRQPILGAALDPEVFATRDGRITRELVVLPYLRIQSVRLTQGPLQRMLGLASVHADTAGSLTGVAAHRDLTEARLLAAELTSRALAAREADLAAQEADLAAQEEDHRAGEPAPPGPPEPVPPATSDGAATTN